MKRYTIILPALFVIFFTCQESQDANNAFKINAIINNVKDSTLVYIRYDSILDSTFIRNGKFMFNGKVSKPTRGILYLKESLLSEGFWIENTKIQVKAEKDNKNKTIVEGGDEQKMANIHRFRNLSAKMELDSIDNFFMNNAADLTDEEKGIIFNQLEELNLKIESNSESFIREYPNCYESIFCLNSKKTIWDKTVLQELFLLMNEDVKKTYYGELLSNHLKLNINPQIGDKYVDFIQKDTNNQDIKFSEVKKRVTLIEFWASWCVPCRNSYPELKVIYNTFNPKGFEIVGVSIDKKEENWHNAIEQDDLPWVNLTDLKGNDNQAVIIYNVKGVPDNVLINEEGIIIGRDMNPKELESALSAYFNP